MSVDEQLNEMAGNENAGSKPRLPYWAIGLVLLGLVVAILVGAFLLDRQLRPSVGIEPAPSVPAAAKPTMAPKVAAQPTARLGVAPPTAVAATAPQTKAGATPPAGLPTSASALEQEVEQAYLRYWDLYSEALLNLDTARMAEVAAGDELRRIEEEVDGFRQRNRAVRVRVTHKYVIFDVTQSEAKVHDEILNRSFTVDPVTKQPPQGSDEADLEKDLYFFNKMDGVWKVVKSVRQEG